MLAGERIHPSWTVPGGVNAPLKAAARDQILAGLPEAKRIAKSAVALFKRVVGDFGDEMTGFGSTPTMYAGLVDRAGNQQLYDGDLRFVDADGEIVVDRMAGLDYRRLHRRGDGSRIPSSKPRTSSRSAIPKAPTASGRWRD